MGSAAGPSPRVWGKPLGGLGGYSSLRTIPTRVGKTPRRELDSQHAADHPHACGENCQSLRLRQRRNGPSPRVWGKLADMPIVKASFRTIPTRVGKTTPRQADGPSRSDHPHACGENCSPRWPAPRRCGPSPRVWGKLSCFPSPFPPARTIPTRVGKTNPAPSNFASTSDHPHACGENTLTSKPETTGLGPSPRVWGKHRI